MERKQEQLGKYELLRRLGEGGMGEVWQARDTQLQRYVAIKLLRTDLRDDPDFSTRFMREARLVAALHHPNIIQIHDFQLAHSSSRDVQAYMVMDYIEGGTLADALKATVQEGRFWPDREVVDFFTPLSLALDYAHEQGMIHRDIKPANILLDKSLAPGRLLGVPVLTDFGIARWAGGNATVADLLGTPRYISPEQAQNLPLDARSDLYSLGIVLYEVLTGTVPFHGDNPLAMMLQHVHEQPPQPALINPFISPALAAVVMRSIAKDPQARFPSARAMTIALTQALNLPVPTLLRGPAESRTLPAARPLPAPVSAAPVSYAPSPAFTPMAGLATDSRSASTPTDAGLLTRTTPAGPAAPAQKPIRRPPRKFWLLGLAGILVLLLGLGAAVLAPRLLTSSGTPTPTPTITAGITGQILFQHSSSAPANTFDTLQVDLSNVVPPPAGQIYYAWLIPTNNESVIAPHWQLQVNNGAIHSHYTSNIPHVNLFLASQLFLITSEDTANLSTPVVPNFALPQRLYYAPITHNTAIPSPSFPVRHCPAGTTNNPCL